MTDVIVSSGVTSSGVTVNGANPMQVLSGGTAVDTTVVNDGEVNVRSGGQTFNTTAYDAGGDAIYPGGIAFYTVLYNGAEQGVQGTALGTIANDGLIEVDSGTLISATLNSGSSLDLHQGGVASATTINSGAVDGIYGFGCIASGTVVNDGGTQILSGGTASATIVNLGGDEFVSVGTTFGTTLLSGGIQSVQGDGYDKSTAVGTIANSDTVQYVYSAATTTGTLLSGGQEFVFSGGTAYATTIGSGGLLNLAAGAAASGGVLFAGGSATFVVTGTSIPTTTISGFAATDAIELRSIAYDSAGSATLDAGTDILTVFEGGTATTLQLAGDYSDAAFQLSTIGGTSSGTRVTLDEMPCFAAGTRILTEAGEVPVEALDVGAMAMVRVGDREEAARIIWIGHRRVSIDSHPDPQLVRPVRIAAGALGDHVPKRTLRLSPDHGLLLDGVLIAARQLVNHASITLEEVPAIHYYHVELERHAILLADGVPVESYLDTGNRNQFSSHRDTVCLHADFSRSDPARSVAPLVTDSVVVQPIWQRLADRAAGMGLERWTPFATHDADLRLIGEDGHALHPQQVLPDGRHIFILGDERGAGGVVRLLSRHAAPADLRPWEDDRRPQAEAGGDRRRQPDGRLMDRRGGGMRLAVDGWRCPARPALRLPTDRRDRQGRDALSRHGSGRRPPCRELRAAGL